MRTGENLPQVALQKYRGTMTSDGKLKKWDELPTAYRAVLTGAALSDLGLRAWALADVATRPQSQVRGGKMRWAVSLGLLNTMCILPAAYLFWARKK